MQKIYLFILVMILNIQYLSSSQVDFDNLPFAHSEASKKANSLDAELSKYFPANNIKTIISDFLHKKKSKKNTNNPQAITFQKDLNELWQKSIKLNNATNTDLYRALDPYLPKSLHEIVGQYLDSYEIIREFSVENSQFNYLQNSGKLFSIVDDHLQIVDLQNNEAQRVKFKSDEFNARDIKKFYELKDGFFIFLTKHKALYTFDTKLQICTFYTGNGNELTLASGIRTNTIPFEDLFLLINKSFATIDSQNKLEVWRFTEDSDADDKIFDTDSFEQDSKVITVCLNRNIIISCTDNGMVWQWDYNTRQHISTEDFGVQIGLMQLSDGIMVMQDQKSQIRIFDKTGITKKIISLLDENDKIINLPNFLPHYQELNDNKLMVSLGNYIYIIDLNTLNPNKSVNPILTMPNGKIIEGFAMLSNENIVTLDNTGSIQIWAKQFKHMTQSNQSFSQKTEFDKVDMECLTQN